jgi:hypothetical protein
MLNGVGPDTPLRGIIVSGEKEMIPLAYDKKNHVCYLVHRTLGDIENELKKMFAKACLKAHDDEGEVVHAERCGLRAKNNLVCAHPTNRMGEHDSAIAARKRDFIPMIELANMFQALGRKVPERTPEFLRQYAEQAESEAELLVSIVEKCAKDSMGLDYAMQYVQDPERSEKDDLRHEALRQMIPDVILAIGLLDPKIPVSKDVIKEAIEREEKRIGKEMLFVRNRLLEAFRKVLEHGGTLDVQESPQDNKVVEKDKPVTGKNRVFRWAKQLLG